MVQKILQIVLLAIGAVVAALAAYFAWRLVRSHVFLILFCLFTGIGVVITCFSLVAYRRALWGKEPDLFLVSATNVSSAKKLRFLVPIEMLVLLCGGWIYPMLHDVITGGSLRDKGNLRRINSTGVLMGIAARTPPITLLLAIIATATASLTLSSSIWIVAFLQVLAAQTMLRHVLYWLSPNSLPKTLRLSTGNAYLLFLSIAVFDLLTLVLTFSAFTSLGLNLSDSFTPMLKIGRSLLFGGFWEVVTNSIGGKEPRLIDVAIALAGALYSRTIVESLVRLKDFRRTDEDKCQVGMVYCSIGRFTDGVNWFRTVNDVVLAQAEKLGYHIAYAQALLALGQFDRALEQVGTGLKLFDVGQSLRDKLAYLNICFSSGQYPMPPQSLLEMLGHAVDLGIDDVTAAFVLMNPKVETTSLEERLAVLGSRFDSTKYPLAYGVHLLIQREAEEAAKLFRGVAPDNDLGRLIRVVLLLLAGSFRNTETTLEQDLDFFDNWTRLYRKNISGWMTSDSLNSIDRHVALTMVMLIHSFSYSLGSQYEQPWRFIWEEVIQNYTATDPLCKMSFSEVTNIGRALISRLPVASIPPRLPLSAPGINGPLATPRIAQDGEQILQPLDGSGVAHAVALADLREGRKNGNDP